MSDPWYVTLAELITHLPLISTMVASYTYRKRSAYMGVVFVFCLIIFFNSFFYHLCDSTGSCIFGASSWSLQQNDNGSAFSGIVVILIPLVTAILVAESSERDSIFWSLGMLLSITWFINLIVITSITGPNQQVGVGGAIMVIGFAASVAFLKILFVDRGNLKPYKRFTDWPVWTGFIFILAGVVCFLLEYPGYEWITHSFWHLLVFTGMTLVVIGSMSNLPDASYGTSREPSHNLQRITVFVERKAEAKEVKIG